MSTVQVKPVTDIVALAAPLGDSRRRLREGEGKEKEKEEMRRRMRRRMRNTGLPYLSGCADFWNMFPYFVLAWSKVDTCAVFWIFSTSPLYLAAPCSVSWRPRVQEFGLAWEVTSLMLPALFAFFIWTLFCELLANAVTRRCLFRQGSTGFLVYLGDDFVSSFRIRCNAGFDSGYMKASVYGGCLKVDLGSCGQFSRPALVEEYKKLYSLGRRLQEHYPCFRVCLVRQWLHGFSSVYGGWENFTRFLFEGGLGSFTRFSRWKSDIFCPVVSGSHLSCVRGMSTPR